MLPEHIMPVEISADSKFNAAHSRAEDVLKEFGSKQNVNATELSAAILMFQALDEDIYCEQIQQNIGEMAALKMLFEELPDVPLQTLCEWKNNWQHADVSFEEACSDIALSLVDEEYNVEQFKAELEAFPIETQQVA